MKQLLIAIGLLIGLSVNSQQVARSLTASTGLFIGFYEYKPVTYNPAHKYPLIIFLHGIGERGNGTTDLPNVLTNAIPKYINAGNTMTFTSLSGVQETFLVLSPQLSTAYGSWQNIYVDEMLKYARANLSIDTNRIFLCGLSLGGGGTWKYATASTANAGTFASIMVTCGTCEWGNMCNLSSVNLPVWAFHALDDGTVPVSCTQNAISMMMTCNPTVVPLKTIYPTGNHWIWDMSFDTTHNMQNPNVYEWFLGQGRNLPPNKLPIANAGPDKIVTLPYSDVQLDGTSSTDPDGSIKRYVWRMIQSPGGGWIQDPSAASTTCHYLSQGTYLFELEVVDDRASWSKDTIKVTVNPTYMNLPPVANAGKDSTNPAITYTANASSSYDPDGYVAGYSWREISGPSSAIITCPTCATTNITNLSNGPYQLEVEVTDNLGAKTRDTMQLNEVGSLLPSGILYLKGKNVDKNNIIEWATATEFNSDHFEIQRSVDAKTYVTVGTIAAAGTSSRTILYSYTDDNAPANTSYYRLMQVDKDGSFKYSMVVSVVNYQGKWLIETYPNPVMDQLLVHVSASQNGMVNMRLVNQQGQILRNVQIQKHGEEIDTRVNMKDVPTGVYFLEIRIGDGLNEVRKVVKE